MTVRLEMSLTNDVQEVARVLDQLEKFSARYGIPAGDALRFAVALDELITNIITHGYGGRSNGFIELVVEFRDGVLHAELSDNGPAFNPLAFANKPPQGSIEVRDVGGLGLTLVKSFMDRLDYGRADGINRLTMEMKLKAG